MCLYDIWLPKREVGECRQIKTLREEVYKGRKSNSSLLLHIRCSNYVAKIWRSFLTSWLDADKISENGWRPDGWIYWIDDVFPREIEDILCEPKYIGNNDFDEEDEQSSRDHDDSDGDTY